MYYYGAEPSVHYREVSFIQRCPLLVWGRTKCPLFRGVTNVLVWGRTKCPFAVCYSNPTPTQFSVLCHDYYCIVLQGFKDFVAKDAATIAKIAKLREKVEVFSRRFSMPGFDDK